MDPKVAGLLGFARKANKLVSGEAAAQVALKKGRAKLVIMAEDVSSNLHRRYSLWCIDIDVPIVTSGTKLLLGLALGQSPRSIVVITDDNFARSILRTGGFDDKQNGV